ncbi:WD40/YVTN/BNR-like repeat-containing protein, partial [Chloroflexota bacterium]
MVIVAIFTMAWLIQSCLSSITTSTNTNETISDNTTEETPVYVTCITPSQSEERDALSKNESIAAYNITVEGPSQSFQFTVKPTINYFVKNSIMTVTYNRGNGMWIAGGIAGSFIISYDGVNWEAVDIGATSILTSAADDSQIIIGGSTGIIYTSTDGVNWISHDSGFKYSPTDNSSMEGANYIFVFGIAHNQNGMWIAVGPHGKLATSSDVIRWTYQDAGFGSSAIRSISYGDGLWIATGEDGKLAISTDGFHWKQQDAGFGASPICAIRYNGSGLWVAGGGGGKLATSPDGITWTQQDAGFGTSAIIWAVEFGDGQWVIAGDDGKLAASKDGEEWITLHSGFGTATIFSIEYNLSDLWVIAGDYGKLATSHDGKDWILLDSKFPQNDIRVITSDASSNWVMGMNAGYIGLSNDGELWTACPVFDASNVLTVEFGAGKWVIGGVHSRAAFSTDRAKWYPIESSFGHD